MPLPPFLANIIGWLRAGYPEGVPERDYIPLLALLRRRLSDDEVAAVADELNRSYGRPLIDRTDIQVRITKVTNELPNEEDVTRVRQHLEAAGWPTTDLFQRDDDET